VVHALTGKVAKVDTTGKTILLSPDDGSEGLFNVQVRPTQLDFSKDVKDATTPAEAFSKTGTQVLVFYIGDGAVRTAVAVEDLGPGPFTKAVGTVAKFDRHGHALTIKTDAGVEESFRLDAKTVAEGMEGVQPGEKFQVHKGDRVSVVGTSESGTLDARFVREL
jgi:hypothetical protein